MTSQTSVVTGTHAHQSKAKIFAPAVHKFMSNYLPSMGSVSSEIQGVNINEVSKYIRNYSNMVVGGGIRVASILMQASGIG